MALLALQLGQYLIAHQLARCFVTYCDQFLRELGKGDLGIDHDRLHGSHVAQSLENLYRIEDTERLFFNLVTQARGAAQHLVEQDAAIHPAQKYEVTDFWHVDTGGEQIDGDCHIGIALVLVASDQLQWFVSSASDLDNGVIIHAAVSILKGCLEQIDHQIRVRIIGTKDQRLAAESRVKLFSQIFANNPVEWHCDHLAVEILNVHLNFIRRLEEFDLVVLAVQNLDVLTCFPFNAVGRKFCINLHWWFVIDQITIDYCLAITVGVDRGTKDFCGVQGRRGSQTNLVSIKVVEHAAVF